MQFDGEPGPLLRPQLGISISSELRMIVDVKVG